MWRVLALSLALLGVGCGKERKHYTVPELIQTLKDSDPDMRYWAARELGKTSGPDAKAAVEALAEALRDPDETVRMGAAYGLADLGPEAKSAVPALKQASKDTSKQVRDAAAHAMKKVQAGK